MTKRIRPPKKRFDNIQNFDFNQCFRWCLIRYLNPVDHHPERIRNVDKLFEGKLGFKDTKFPVKIRDIHKTEKRIPSALSF